MNKTLYVSLNDITEPQTNIMEFIDIWVHREKTPVPFKEIIISMNTLGVGKKTTEYSLKILMRKGYIRRTVDGGGNGKAAFVQLRRV